MLIIGLTGGIASGKSTVARRFAKLGAGVIDTDALAREVLAPGSEGLAEVVRVFGADLLAADGTLDRRALRRRIFEDAKARARLEAITHPRIRTLLEQRLSGLDAPYAMVEIPLLIECGLNRVVDRTLVVDCTEETQICRLLLRDGETAASARAALAAQTSRSERLKRADDVIENDGPTATLGATIARLHRRYLQLARAQAR